MNAERRKKLENIWSALEEALEQEQESLDNIPDHLQYEEKGSAMQENIDELEEAKDLVRNIIDR